MVVEQIEGCFSNVIGLSLPLLRRWLAGDCSGS
jgi:septum formation protein